MQASSFNTYTNISGFYNLAAQLKYDKDAKTDHILIIIPFHRLNMGNKAFNITLKSADFFDIKKFPLAYFQLS